MKRTLLLIFWMALSTRCCGATDIVVTESSSPGTPIAASPDGEYVAFRMVGGVLGQFDQSVVVSSKDSVAVPLWKRFYNDTAPVRALFIDNQNVLVGNQQERDICNLKTGILKYRFSEAFYPLAIVEGRVITCDAVAFDNTVEALSEIDLLPIHKRSLDIIKYIGHAHRTVYDTAHKNVYISGDYGTFKRLNMTTHQVTHVAKSVGGRDYGYHFRELAMTHDGWLLALTKDGIMKVDTRRSDPPREYDEHFQYDINVPRSHPDETLKGLGFISDQEFWVATRDNIHLLSWPECQILKSHRISPPVNDNPKLVPRTVRCTLNIPHQRMALLLSEREDLFIVRFP